MSSEGTGALRLRVLRQIADASIINMVQIPKAIKAAVSGKAAKDFAHALHRDGLIYLRRGGEIGVTERGRALLGTPAPMFPNGLYRPVSRVVARPGGEVFRAIPSVYAGETKQWRPTP